MPFYLFSRPLTSFARQTQKFCLRDLRRQKSQIASRYYHC